MPLNPLDNMPEALKRQRFSIISNELVKGHSDTEGFTSNGHLENECHPLNFVKQSQVNIFDLIHAIFFCLFATVRYLYIFKHVRMVENPAGNRIPIWKLAFNSTFGHQ